MPSDFARHFYFYFASNQNFSRLSSFVFRLFIIFAPEKIAKLYQNKKIGGDEAIFSPSKESNPQHTWAYVRNLTTEDWWKKESIGTI